MWKLILHGLLFIALTAVTQVGGIIYLISFFLHPLLNRRFAQRTWLRRILKLLAFLTLYLFISLVVIPPLAKSFGRTPLPIHQSHVQPANILTVILNRHYVRPQLKQLLFTTASALHAEYPGSSIVYLDANFPFINGYPLFPHLSHNDGKKADLAFCYREKGGALTSDVPTFSGYGAYEAPLAGEDNMPEICEQKGHWQYSISKAISFSGRNDNLQMDNARTQTLLRTLSASPLIQKIFLEPHLKKRLNLTESKIRFHGCHAARHDDHIHLQIQ